VLNPDTPLFTNTDEMMQWPLALLIIQTAPDLAA
jgi:hypothetical protein